MDEEKLAKLLDKKLNSFKAEIEKSIEEKINKAFASQFKAINLKLQEIEKAQQFQSEQYESLRLQVGNVLRINTELKDENEQLLKRIRDVEKKDLQRQKALDDLEQYGRRSMIEISGIPRSQNENCEALIIEVGKKIGVEIEEKDIEVSHRNSAKQDAAIITKFASRKVSDKFLEKNAKIKAKKLKAADLGFEQQSDAGRRLFINESLTQRNKNLLRLTKLKKNELDYKFVWTRNGNIFVRKNETAPIKKINFTSDLDSLQ